MTYDGWRVIGPLAYMGKKDCESMFCRRMIERQEDGAVTLGRCMGWHCSYCDEACGPQGHGCDAAVTLLDEARRLS